MRISGANREVKKAVEAYWAGKLSADQLTKAAADVKKASWTSLKERGVNLIPRCAVYPNLKIGGCMLILYVQR